MQEVEDIVMNLHAMGLANWWDTYRWHCRMEKEILFREGYTDGRAKSKVVVDPIIGRWIGWKVVMYNLDNNNNTAVKMESYIDNRNTNYCVQVTNLTDGGMVCKKLR